MTTHRYETLIKAVIEINDDGSGDVTADLTFKILEGERFTADLMAGDEGRDILMQGGWQEGYSREEFEELPDGTVLQEEAVGMPYVKVGRKIVPKHELFVPATDQLAKFIVTEQ